MTEVTLEVLREELKPIREELKPIHDEFKRIAAFVDGIPLMHRTVTTILQEQRMLRSTINDLARVQVTAGEIQALHDDVNRVMTQVAELEVQIATLQRTKQDKS